MISKTKKNTQESGDSVVTGDAQGRIPCVFIFNILIKGAL